MKFYIASKLENYEQVSCLSGMLKAAGWTHTYDWTIHGSVKECGEEVLKEVAMNEYIGVKDADIVIVLTPQGRGTHTELGIALALNKKVYICHIDDTYFKTDDNTSSFYWLPQVTHFVGTIDDIVHELTGVRNSDGLCEKLPTIEEAEELLEWANNLNRGPWAEHSRVVARAAKTIAEKCGMDGEKAYILGLLHDIGRYEGVRGMHHVYAGYDLMKSKGYSACARICLTHTYVLRDVCSCSGKLDCTDDEVNVLKTALDAVTYDNYDKLVQLCDAISLAEGVCLMDVRLLEAVMRLGFSDYTIGKYNAYFSLKDYFDNLSGMNIYDLFYDEIRDISFSFHDSKKNTLK